MDINAEISDMKVALASLEAKAKAQEKPKQWEPKCEPCSPSEMTARRSHGRLLAYVREYGSDWEAGWEDKQQKKYYVYYSYHTLGWCMHHAYNSTIGGTVYMSQKCALRLVKKLNSGEVVL